MVKKTLLGSIALFLIYTGLMYLRPNLSYAQNQEQTNIVNAQKYLYGTTAHTNVIVGSSLSARLVMSELPGFENLAFSGLTPIDGLNIVQRANSLPADVYIETNTLYKPFNTTFDQQIFAPLPFYTKKYLISLRDGKKPLAFTELVITAVITKFLPDLFAPYTPVIPTATTGWQWIPAAHAQDAMETPASTNSALGIIATEYQTVNQLLLEQNVSQLSADVQYLSDHGVRVHFYEMPIHQDLVHSPLATAQRNLMLEHFPADQYDYIPPPDNLYGNDGDGIHMNPTVAKEYTLYFRDQIPLE